ncbi:hypothetical protein [Streptomyces sp. NPDC019890]|uniref:hypothetical protein n=1 Tax=Streptomyces sp. NPDC019890 TaxID=3365064 RepID=UPI00384B77E4
MGAVPMSVALLVKVALEAAGPGAALWGKLKAIVETPGTFSGAVDSRLDTDVLDVLVDSPLSVDTAQSLFAGLLERAQRDDTFRAELESWAQQAWSSSRDAVSEKATTPGTLKGSSLQARPGVEAHFAIYGVADYGHAAERAGVSSSH